MLEVKGRAVIVLPFFVIAIVLAVAGWVGLDWVDQLGKLWWIVCLTLLLSSVPIAAIGLFKALDRRPLLVVDAAGVHDRVTSPARRFGWDEIKGFRLSPAGSRKPQVLAIDVIDPERAIAQARLGMGALMEATRTQHGSPCVVWLNALDIDPVRLLSALQSLQLKHGPARR